MVNWIPCDICGTLFLPQPDDFIQCITAEDWESPREEDYPEETQEFIAVCYACQGQYIFQWPQ